MLVGHYWLPGRLASFQNKSWKTIGQPNLNFKFTTFVKYKKKLCFTQLVKHWRPVCARPWTSWPDDSTVDQQSHPQHPAVWSHLTTQRSRRPAPGSHGYSAVTPPPCRSGRAWKRSWNKEKLCFAFFLFVCGRQTLFMFIRFYRSFLLHLLWKYHRTLVWDHELLSLSDDFRSD